MNKLIAWFSAFHVWVYRKSGGRIMGNFPTGRPDLLLTTTGRKSGLTRTTPLLYMNDGDRILIVASKGGMPTHPAWYHNIKANPECSVQIMRDVIPVVGRIANPEERKALWPKLVEFFPGYGEYQKKTDREIPVVILERKTRA